MPESKQGEQPPRGETAPLKCDRARTAARENQLNEQKVEVIASNNKIHLVQPSFVFAIAHFLQNQAFNHTHMQSVTYA